MRWKVAEFAIPRSATSKDYFEKAIEKQMQEKLSAFPVFA